MRAYQLPKGGAGIDALTLVDRPMPKPQYRQVLVKVAACSLNYRDLLIMRGGYRAPVRDNFIPLSDGAGEVVEVGPGVTRVKAGDKVAGCFFQRWAGGEPEPDIARLSARRRARRHARRISPCWRRKASSNFPSTCHSRKARHCPAPASPAWDAIMNHAKLVAGQTVLLQGTGGVSIFGVQLAHAHGHRRRSSPRRATRSLTRAKALGAASASTTRPPRNGTKRRADFTGGRGVDQVLEVGGVATLTRSFSAIRIGGKISIIGGVSGGATELNPGLIFSKRANVQGISVGSMQIVRGDERRHRSEQDQAGDRSRVRLR